MGAPQPVELGDDQLVPCPVGRKQGLVRLGPASQLPGSRVKEDLLTAGSRQCVVLGLGMLIAGGDAPVSDSYRNVSPTPLSVTQARTVWGR